MSARDVYKRQRLERHRQLALIVPELLAHQVRRPHALALVRVALGHVILRHAVIRGEDHLGFERQRLELGLQSRGQHLDVCLLYTSLVALLAQRIVHTNDQIMSLAGPRLGPNFRIGLPLSLIHI